MKINLFMKFILLCQYRSGSTMLCRTLNNHPQIKVGEEILHNSHPSMISWRKKIYNNQYYKKNFLNKKFIDLTFENLNGFKIMFNQIDKSCEIWDVLNKIPNLKVIFLTRKNLLEAFLSLKISLITNVWQKEKINSCAENIEPFFLQKTEILKYFTKTETEIEYYKKFFFNKNQLHLTYENLIGSWNCTIKKIQKFLQVEKVELYPALEKLNKNYYKHVKNFSEIKNFIYNTKYKHFFNIKFI